MKYITDSLFLAYSQKEVMSIGQFIMIMWTRCIVATNSTKLKLTVSVLDGYLRMLSLMYRVSDMVKRNLQTLQSETAKHSEVIYLQGSQFCKNKIVSLSNRQKKKAEKRAQRAALQQKPKLVPTTTGKVEEKPNNVLQPFIIADDRRVEDLSDLTMMQRWMRGC